MDFIDVRKHEPIFASLKMIDAVKERASSDVRGKRKEFEKQSDEAKREAEEARDAQLKEIREEIAELQKKSRDGSIPRPVIDAKSIEFQTKQERLQRALDVKTAKIERDADRNIAKISVSRISRSRPSRIKSKRMLSRSPAFRRWSSG